MRTSKSYDNLDRLTLIGHQRLSGDQTTVAAYAYAYNNASRAHRARRPASRQRQREQSASEVPTFQRVRVEEVDGTYWLYSYDGLGQVTGGTSRPRASGGDGPPRVSDGGSGAPATRQLAADGTILPGHDFGYAYDDIGNRKSATTNGRTETYTPNLLSRAKRDGQHAGAGTERSGVPTPQYEQRTVPNADDVLGSADAAALVFVNQQPATRKDELWHAEVSGDNSQAADAPDVRIDAIKLGAGPGGEDVVATEEGNLFIPRTPESFTYGNDGEPSLQARRPARSAGAMRSRAPTSMLSDGRWLYVWNGENRLIQLETDPAVWSAVNGAIPRQKFLFAYDHIGRRTTKTVYTWDTQTADWTLTSSLRFIYDGWNLLAELEPVDYQAATFDWQVTRSYVWGTDLSGSLQGAGGVGGLLFATRHDYGLQSTASSLPLYDGNGNVMQYLSTTTATITAAYTYTPFGQTLTASGDSESLPFRFSTKYTDESGLVYYGYRYYDAERGRWVNRDPIEEKGGDNLYVFVRNDGENGFDVQGMFPGSIGHGTNISPSGSSAHISRIQNTADRQFDAALGLMGMTSLVSNELTQSASYLRNLYRLATYLRINGTGSTNKFVFTCKYGWIDHGHLLNNALITYGSSLLMASTADNVRVIDIPTIAERGRAVAFLGSFINEVGQYIAGSNSAWSAEDLLSNRLGRDMGVAMANHDLLGIGIARGFGLSMPQWSFYDISAHWDRLLLDAGAVKYGTGIAINGKTPEQWLNEWMNEVENNDANVPIGYTQWHGLYQQRKHQAFKCLCDGDTPKLNGHHYQ